MSRHLESLLRDFRSSIRVLAGRPGWATAAILCLAIAAGANTAAFTAVNGLLLRPLPFPDADRLVMVAIREPRQTSTRPFALREYRQLADASKAAGTLLARTFFPLSLAANDGARMAQAELVSGNYFATLQVTPFLGRFFDNSDDREGAAPAAVLSHRLWEVRFGADPAVIGQSVRVNGRTGVITAVAPPGFVGAMRLIAADLWLPAAMYPDLAGSADAATTPMFGVMGRLPGGITLDQAEAALSAAHTQTDDRREASPSVVVAPATGFGVPVAVHGTVLTLSGLIYLMMALLMAVACANVAALVLARGASRSREIAIRLSLGASRMQIARQLAIESLVLAAAGCTGGAVAAVWLTQAVVAGLSTPFQYVSYAVDVHPDARVLGYSVLTTAAAAVLCGIAPIRSAGRVDVVDVLKQSAANGRSRESMRTLNVTVALQFAVSTTLLVGAGMLVRSYITAQTTLARFETAGLVAATFDVDQIQLGRTAGIRLYQSLMDRLSMLSGVTSVGLSREAPLAAGRPTTILPDRHAGASAEPITASAMVASSRYLPTLGLSVREGRSFADGEPPRPRVAVINEAMARRLWPNTSPVGLTFRGSESTSQPIQVIGVVEDAEASTAGRPAQPAFYQPFPHEYSRRMTVVLRVHGEPSRFYADVRRLVNDLHEDLAIVDLRTVDELHSLRAEQRRIPAIALALIGLLGLLLSAVGLYGVVAYSVRERAREFGIRLAIGARPSDIRRLVLKQGFTTVAIGLALGAAATTVSAQFLRSSVFGVNAVHPFLFVGVCAALVMTAFAALYLPARAASGVEPAFTLHSE